MRRPRRIGKCEVDVWGSGTYVLRELKKMVGRLVLGEEQRSVLPIFEKDAKEPRKIVHDFVAMLRRSSAKHVDPYNERGYNNDDEEEDEFRLDLGNQAKFGQANGLRVSCAAQAAEATSLSYPRQLHPLVR